MSLGVTIPVGPECTPRHLRDTVESVAFYCAPCSIFLINDTGDRIPSLDTQVIVIDVSGKSGTHGKLFDRLANVWKILVHDTDIDLVLRLDTDALVIGPHPEHDARVLFAATPHVGLLGSYRTTCMGNPRSFADAVRTIRKATGLMSYLFRPRQTAALREILDRANGYGYEMGEHVLGGAYFISRPCLEHLDRRGYLDGVRFDGVDVPDDHLLGLLVRSCGMELADFALDGPLGLAWRGLPASPQDLRRMDKKIIHSVRYWNGMDEDSIRRFFHNAIHQD